MKFKFKKTAGFSLVELIIYVGLSLVILTVITSLFISVLESQTRSQIGSVLEQDGKYIISKLSYEITQADDLVIPANLSQQSSQLQLTSSGQTVSFSLSGQTLSLSKNLNTYKLHSPEIEVSSFQVTRLGNVDGQQALTINLTLTSLNQTAGGPSTKDYQTTVSLR